MKLTDPKAGDSNATPATKATPFTLKEEGKRPAAPEFREGEGGRGGAVGGVGR